MATEADPLARDGRDPAAIAGWVLRVTAAVFAIGWCVAIFSRAGTSVGSIALMEWGVAHPRIALVERWTAVLVLLAGLSLLARPTVVAALIVAIVPFIEALAARHTDSYAFATMAPASHALRYGLPLALAWMVLPAWSHLGERARVLGAMWMLRLGIAAVFVAHGVQALGPHPEFTDMLIATARRWLGGYRLTESNAVAMLRVIGIVDIGVGFMVLAGRWRPLLLWLALWSLVTAMARVTSWGIMSYPEVLLRASHVGAPLAVWALGACVLPRSSPAEAPAPAEVRAAAT